MINFFVKLVCILILILTISSLKMEVDAIDKEIKNILILNSYHRGYKWTDDIGSGIVKQYQEQSKELSYEIDFIYEFMDTKRIYNETYIKNLYIFLENKYINKKLDLIITTDDNAFDFIMEYGEELFPSIPVLFCGVNYLDESRLEGKDNIRGLSEEANIEQSIEFLLMETPNLEKINIVVDDTKTGKIIQERINQLILKKDSKNLIDILNNISMRDLKLKLKNMSKNEIVLYTIFFKDVENNFFEYDKSINEVLESSSVPVYITWDFSLVDGVVGGILTSGFKEGMAIGKMAIQLLNGEDIEKNPRFLSDEEEWIFDWKRLNETGIDISKLPKETIFMNKPVSFYENYKNVIFTAVMILVGFVILTIILMYIIKMKTKLIQIKMDELVVSKEKAEVANIAKGKFLSNISHEFNTPIHGVYSFITLLERTSLNNEQKEHVKYCKESTELLIELIDNLLNISKLEFGNINLEIKKFNLHELIKQCINLFKPKVTEKDIVLDYKINNELPKSVLGDPSKIKQILINIIGNAVKFTEKGQVVLYAELITIVENEYKICVSVIDSGIGINEKVKNKIFEPFVQADNSLTRKYQGVGLGLSITKHLINTMKGSIEVISFEEKGTTVKVILKLGIPTIITCISVLNL